MKRKATTLLIVMFVGTFVPSCGLFSDPIDEMDDTKQRQEIQIQENLNANDGDDPETPPPPPGNN